MKPHLFDIADHATRSSQPAPPPSPLVIPVAIPELPQIITDSPDPVDLLQDKHIHDGMEGSHEMSFRLLDLPLNVRNQILNIVLEKPHLVTPFYYTGCVELEEYLVTEPNIDISLLLVNKQLHGEAADILYGINDFRFSKPELALWWFRHIGPSNVNRVRNAHFFMDSFEYPTFQVREERLWQSLFTWLEPRQNLEEITLSFERWNMEAYHWKPEFERDRIDLARIGTVEALWNFRGLRSVEIRGGDFLTGSNSAILAQCMMIPKEVSMPEDDGQKTPVPLVRE